MKATNGRGFPKQFFAQAQDVRSIINVGSAQHIIEKFSISMLNSDSSVTLPNWISAVCPSIKSVRISKSSAMKFCRQLKNIRLKRRTNQ